MREMLHWFPPRLLGQVRRVRLLHRHPWSRDASPISSAAASPPSNPQNSVAPVSDNAGAQAPRPIITKRRKFLGAATAAPSGCAPEAPGSVTVSAPPAGPSASAPAPAPSTGPVGAGAGLDLCCSNCGERSTPLWRRGLDNCILCNACGLYLKLHNKNRPRSFRPNHHSRTSAGVAKDGTPLPPLGSANVEIPSVECTNCRTRTTPLWRRDEAGRPLCNACGLYHKLHREHRQVSAPGGAAAGGSGGVVAGRKRQRAVMAATAIPGSAGVVSKAEDVEGETGSSVRSQERRGTS
ncbi:hypothetical protein BC829DRAFT_236416 [Chytridium lagenaria]|nr:hypothetical protein BC829DRAFT_236416 [Chytridium lagenaria]